MIKNILIAFVAIFMVAVIAVWFISGGPSKTLSQLESGPGFFSTLFGTGSSTGAFSFILPFQPTSTYKGIDLGYFASNEEDSGYDGLTDEERYEAEQERIRQAQTFGDPSPYRGSVSIGSYETSGSETEYIEIINSSQAEISITGWSIQSMVSGLRYPITTGANSFVMGSVNANEPIKLSSDMRAVIISGPSPVGVSFRENMCTGYLQEFGQFNPSLSLQCPAASSELPKTAQNVSTYGASCFTHLERTPLCTRASHTPSEISAACSTFVQQTLTYTGCADRHRWRSSFLGGTWRIYLGGASNVWSDESDVLRLLDADGRVVDVLSY